ncbi:hypothetical protein DL89DRAFT_171899 [Linderina pennispora]|uniref:Uncharacterized protein n=1 Tax=Linderina pennispora TaxID=61395 RepID=A0A1Y1W6H8_9FUNG|nr:uncharacterized protein DL89DRAFT_171899 [Linderina pennispora]ORX69121.1 hypothetical protein DL89DRAFT_171899 [Linderina pennispora]
MTSRRFWRSRVSTTATRTAVAPRNSTHSTTHAFSVTHTHRRAVGLLRANQHMLRSVSRVAVPISAGSRLSTNDAAPVAAENTRSVRLACRMGTGARLRRRNADRAAKDGQEEHVEQLDPLVEKQRCTALTKGRVQNPQYVQKTVDACQHRDFARWNPRYPPLLWRLRPDPPMYSGHQIRQLLPHGAVALNLHLCGPWVQAPCMLAMCCCRSGCSAQSRIAAAAAAGRSSLCCAEAWPVMTRRKMSSAAVGYWSPVRLRPAAAAGAPGTASKCRYRTPPLLAMIPPICCWLLLLRTVLRR